jgi:hypothetical protein
VLTKVDTGEFSIAVCMTPKVAMAKKEHFSEVTVRGDTKFHQRLVIVVADEMSFDMGLGKFSCSIAIYWKYPPTIGAGSVYVSFSNANAELRCICTLSM